MLFSSKKKKQGKDSIISTDELFNKQSSEVGENEDIETKLSILPEWLDSIEQEYILRFLNNENKPLKPNQISLSGIEINQTEDEGLLVTAFVRSSLDKGIQFSSVPIVLIGSEGELLARKNFDLGDLGELPPRSSRPWHFYFAPEDIYSMSFPEEGWKLAFEMKKEHELDLSKEWEQSLTEEDKEKLTQLLKNVQPPKSGEINFMGIQANRKADDLHITLLIRNGSDKNIKIESLPLIVEDAAGDQVAAGGFKLDDFEVKANTSKPWTFIFPSELIQKDNPDFSSWKAYPPNQK
ncbi:accessory Sec system S-layer assembly protein [Heyndrickxia vini]|uniref:Accessory Sec system S-layer assembly protein n=1 Tax=Heyndrickxia vini TaxID=1476025 RepID=A0ABX7E4Q2_9BACI|nr:accessory Sec system S-layer assembly protein [Heyndrickxia vini]QQZ10249.1 accessory Sec system S-layer assembly protein [Heyndrickxia vini]